LTARSLLPQIAALWAGFSSDVKDDWAAAAAVEKNLINLDVWLLGSTVYGTAIFGESYYGIHIDGSIMNGWRLFVQDQSARIKNDMAGTATPSLFHQSWVGNLHVESPSSELKITQIHPHFYWISRKVRGKKGMYEPVLVTEDLVLPITISFNFKLDITSILSNSLAKLYARFWYSYQGVDRYEDLPIDMLLEFHLPALFGSFFLGVAYFGDESGDDWINATATLTTLVSYVIRYDMYFELKDLTGDVFFDNISVVHSGQNWIRDPYCLDILQGFTRAFYQIPAHWAVVTLPEGAQYDSIYRDF
jgi:hypothetical protein